MGYLYRVGKTWYIGYQDHRGRWVRRSTRTTYKEAAWNRLKDAEIRIARGESIEGKPEQTFAAFAEEYVRHKAGIGYDVERVEDCLGHLLPVFGERLLGEISRESVERYVAQRLSEKARPGTAQKEITVLKAAFNQAIRWDRVERNPAAKVSVKGANDARERLLSEEELGRLLEACPDGFRDLIEIALLTGTRKGELLALGERDCDFLREQIRVRHSKTGHARTIPMHPRVKEILWARCTGNEHRQIFLIVNVQRPFTKAVKDAGLRDVRFHDLRHCAASYLLMAGADPRSVMQILGHKDPRMTLRVYARVSQDHLKEAVGRLRLPLQLTYNSQPSETIDKKHVTP